MSNGPDDVSLLFFNVNVISEFRTFNRTFAS
jgi:hypothetical protein